MAEAFVSSKRTSLQRGLDELERTVLTPQFGNRISDYYGLKGPVAVVKHELKRLEHWPQDAETRVHQLISDIAEDVFDLDDIVTIFGFLVDARFPRKKGSDLMEIYVPDDDEDELNKAGIEIRRLCSRVSNLRRSLDGACAAWTWRIPSSALKKISEEGQLREWRRAYSSVESIVGYVVGFEENIKVLIEQLTREGEGDGVPRVFCVLGMGGIGKTTLAKQIYYHSEIRSHFDSFAWLSISDDEPSDRQRKFNLANEVLIQLTCAAGEAEINRVKQMNDYDSCVDLYHELRKRRFLLVLDDVWSHETLEYLILNGFPKYRCNWKILVTTRKKSVADNFPIYKNVFVHQPRFLDENQSWELFEKKANFGRDAIKDSEDYYEMKELGEKMLEHCAGLPLAITVLGELLSKRRTPNEWKEMLHNNMRTFIHEERRKDHEDLKYSDILWVLGLGDHDLPHNLRQTLLHLAHFPKDSEIKVKELCRIWKAEGFMDIDEGHEATNRRFNMLKDEGMIQVEKLDSYGMIKTIRICNPTRDLCIMSDKDGNNFWEIMDSRKEMDQYSSSPDAFEDVKPTYKTHSVAIYVNRDVAEEFFPLINNDRKAGLRTLICFNRLPYPSYELVIQPLLRRFHKLRVLKFENISYGYVGKLPEEIGELVHLRFLSLKGSHVEQVPSSIGNLIFLQTLDLRTNWKSEFPNVLWRLKQLRHLYLPLRCHISGNKLMFSHLKKIETLVNIPLRYCDLNDRETTNFIYKVRKFKAYFHASLWKDFNLKSSGTSQRRYLESLALENLSRSRVDVVQFLSRHRTRKLHLEGKITQLPEEQFVQNLTKLTLERTYLQNDPMETLAKLPELKILLLKHNAFEGNTMVCSHNGFRRLEYLSLIALEQLEEWNVEEGALSSLSNLLIEDCYKLLTIPSGLRYVTKLKKLVIKRMPREFTTKVEERGNDFYKLQHVPSVELVD